MRFAAATFLTLATLAGTVAATVAATGCSRPSTAAPAAQASVDLVGTWKNEHGSELKVESVVDGRLTGQFRSGVGKVNPSQWFPVSGFVQGDVVGFTVDFTTAESVASWAGQVMDNQLLTQWHLSRDIPDAQEHDQIWSSILTGSDTFTRE